MLPATDDMIERFKRLTQGGSNPRGRMTGHEIAKMRVRSRSIEKVQRQKREHKNVLEKNQVLKGQVEGLRLQLASRVAECRVVQKKLKIMEQMTLAHNGRGTPITRSRTSRGQSLSARQQQISTKSSKGSSNQRIIDAHMVELRKFKTPTLLSPRRPKSSLSSRSRQNRTSSRPDFRPTTAPQKNNKAGMSQLISTKNMTTMRLTADDTNEYGEFRKRIDRLKRQVRDLEAQLSEQKTKARLLHLRQLTGHQNSTGSATKKASHNSRRQKHSTSNIRTIQSSKNGFAESFWEHLRRDKRYMSALGTKKLRNECANGSLESNADSRGEDASTFHADGVLRDLVSEHILSSSEHMTHDVRQAWCKLLSENVTRLCDVSSGFKKLLSAISRILHTSPLTTAATSAAIASEVVELFGAHLVRIFVVTKVKDVEADEVNGHPSSSSFTLAPVAYLGGGQAGKRLVKAERITVGVKGLNTAQLLDSMTKRKSAKISQSQQQSLHDSSTEENSDPILDSSKGVGFVAATFLRGETLLASGDLWEHECFSREADSAWISPSVSTSILCVPLRWNNSVDSSILGENEGHLQNYRDVLPFGVLQLVKSTKTHKPTTNHRANTQPASTEKVASAYAPFDSDDQSLVEGFARVIAPALYSCSNVEKAPLDKSTRNNLANSNSNGHGTVNIADDLKAGSQNIETSANDEQSRYRSLSSASVGSCVSPHGSMSKALSRHIRRAAETASLSGDINHFGTQGMNRFLQSLLSVIHGYLSADRSVLYLAQDLFGGSRLYHGEDILFSPVARAIGAVSQSVRLIMQKSEVKSAEEEARILTSLQKSIEWDSLDGSKDSRLSNLEPFNVHEDMDLAAEQSQHHRIMHTTHHHHHRPRHKLTKRTDLAAYVASQFEVVRMVNASEDPVTKFAVDHDESYTTDSILVVPILLNDETIGVIELFNKHSMAGGNDMLSEEGFTKDDEKLLVHCAREISSALSYVERQGRSGRINETFCQLYHDVGLATVGGGRATSSKGGVGADMKVLGKSKFGQHLIEVEAVIRQLLVAEHVFIWVSDHTVGGLRTFFDNKRQRSNWHDGNNGMLQDVHYSQKQLKNSALGQTYFHGNTVDISSISDARAANLAFGQGNRTFDATVDLPDMVRKSEGSMICVPLRATLGAEKGNYGNRHLSIGETARTSEPVGVLQIINFDKRGLSLRCMLQDRPRLIAYLEQVASHTATVLGCLLRMDSFARGQRMMHDLLGTFAHLHHSSSLQPVDLIRTSADAVRTIFKQSNRKIDRAHLLLRDAEDNFVFACPNSFLSGNVTGDSESFTHESGTGAFDDMFHSFDTAKDKQRSREALKGKRQTLHRPSINLDGSIDMDFDYEVHCFSSEEHKSFAGHVAHARRPIVACLGVEDVAKDIRDRNTLQISSKNVQISEPRRYFSTADKLLGIDVMGSTLGVCVPVSQQDGQHVSDMQCILLLQRSVNSNLPFSLEDRDLAGLIVAHLCAAIAAVQNTADQLRRERALGDILAPTRFEDIERIDEAKKMRSKRTARRLRQALLTLELDCSGHLRAHNGVSFYPDGVGFVSKALAILGTSPSGSQSRVSLNIAPKAESIEDMRTKPFHEWLCQSCLNLVSSVLDAIDGGEPPNMTWKLSNIELDAKTVGSHAPHIHQGKNSPTKKSSSGNLEEKAQYGSTSHQVSRKPRDSVLRFRAIEAFLNTYDDVTEGESRLVMLFQVCDTARHGLLPLHRWAEILKAGIGCSLSQQEAEKLALETQSLVHGDSHQDKKVHYVKFVRTLVPALMPVEKVDVVVIPLFEATTTKHKVDGVFLRFDSCEID